MCVVMRTIEREIEVKEGKWEKRKREKIIVVEWTSFDLNRVFIASVIKSCHIIISVSQMQSKLSRK